MPKDAFGYRVLTAAEIPDLKGAPGQAIVEGQNISHAKLLGKEYRPIQCLRCGGFGHNGIDRECPMHEHNPNEEFRVRLEDPLSLMKAREELSNMQKFVLKVGTTTCLPVAS